MLHPVDGAYEGDIGPFGPDVPFSVLASRRYVEMLEPPEGMVELRAAKAWAIRKPIDECGLWDAVGPYPYFACADWTSLGNDFDKLADDLVTITLITAPVPQPPTDELAVMFDLVRPYKLHWLVDLHAVAPIKHHRQEARRALRRMDVSRSAGTDRSARCWLDLYARLCARHGVVAARRFSERQLVAMHRFAAMRTYEARIDGDACAMALWLLDGDRVHYYLAASSPEGYAAAAGYALMQAALDEFAREGRRVALLGSVPDGQAVDSGLARFKRGWAGGTAQSYLCGRILQPDAYACLLQGLGSTPYFPAYRFGDAL